MHINPEQLTAELFTSSTIELGRIASERMEANGNEADEFTWMLRNIVKNRIESLYIGEQHELGERRLGLLTPYLYYDKTGTDRLIKVAATRGQIELEIISPSIDCGLLQATGLDDPGLWYVSLGLYDFGEASGESSEQRLFIPASVATPRRSRVSQN